MQREDSDYDHAEEGIDGASPHTASYNLVCSMRQGKMRVRVNGQLLLKLLALAHGAPAHPHVWNM